MDYIDTFSHIAKLVTIRILLTMTAQFDWFLNQLDVIGAFLYGTFFERLFMQQPPGFEDITTPNHVCKLHKFLYGLKQAQRAWYVKLHGVLTSLGFTSSQNDHSLFTKKDHSVFVLVYVDDILVNGPSSQACKIIISQLNAMFPIKDVWPIHYFLYLEVKRFSFGSFISQTKYILNFFQKENHVLLLWVLLSWIILLFYWKIPLNIDHLLKFYNTLHGQGLIY